MSVSLFHIKVSNLRMVDSGSECTIILDENGDEGLLINITISLHFKSSDVSSVKKE